MPHYEFSEGTSNKFWEITRSGRTVTTVYGRIGTDGQSTAKDFPDEAKAQAAYDKLIREKTGKGYVLKGAGSTPAKSAPRKNATPSPASIDSFDPEAYFLLHDDSLDFWSGYGSYLVHGYANRVAGKLHLIRTGPYAPALSFHCQQILLNEKLQKSLAAANLRGVSFKNVIKKKVVKIAWHTWDTKAKEPKFLPRRGEPDLYFDRKHDPALAKALGNFFELVIDAEATVSKNSVTLSKAGNDIYVATVDYLPRLVVSGKARSVMQPQLDAWIRFEPLQVKASALGKKPVKKKSKSVEPASGNALPEPSLRIHDSDGAEWIYDIAFSPDNRQVAIQLGNWKVVTFDLKSSQQVSEDAFRGASGKDKPAQLAETPMSGAGIGLRGKKLYGIKGSGRKVLLTKTLGEAPCTAVDLGPNDDGYGSFSPDQTQFIWPTGELLTVVDLATGKTRSTPWNNLPDYSRLVVSNDNRHVALIQDEAVIWIDIATGKEKWRVPAPSSLSSFFLIDPKRLFVGGKEGWQVVAVDKGTVTESITIEKHAVNRVASLGGDKLLVAITTGEDSKAHSLATWNLRARTATRIFLLDSSSHTRVDELVSNADATWVGAVLGYGNLLLWPSSAFK